MRVRSPRLRTAAVMLGAGALLVACGASPTDSNQAGGGSSGGGNDLASVNAAVNGLSGQERQAKLIELAKKSGGSVGFYHSGDLTSEVEAFQSATGIKVRDFQATAERAAERVAQEVKAGQQASDVFVGGVADSINLIKKNSLDDLQSPALQTVPADLQGKNWVSPFVIMQMPSYNSDKLGKDKLPKSWEAFFQNPPPSIGLEITDYEWYETLIRKYFVEKKGMTEAAATTMVDNGLKGATQVDGHTLLANLLASGQFAYAPNAFSHYFKKLQKSGAPVTWDGLASDMPPFAVPLGMGITKGGKNPAGGLLLAEWLLGADGQKSIADTGYVPTSSSFSGDSLLKQYPDTIIQDLGAKDTPEQVATWKSKFDKLLQSIGGKPISK